MISHKALSADGEVHLGRTGLAIFHLAESISVLESSDRPCRNYYPAATKLSFKLYCWKLAMMCQFINRVWFARARDCRFAGTRIELCLGSGVRVVVLFNSLKRIKSSLYTKNRGQPNASPSSHRACVEKLMLEIKLAVVPRTWCGPEPYATAPPPYSPIMPTAAQGGRVWRTLVRTLLLSSQWYN